MLDFLSSYKNESGAGLVALILRFTLRFFQFVLALTVIGLYGQDLHHAAQAGASSDSKWVYAVVVGSLSAFTVLVYGIPFIKSHLFFAWDVVLFILWTAVFGTFGKLYIHEDPESVGHGNGTGPSIQRMKNAVWVDLVNMLLWLTTAIYGTFTFFTYRRRTLHTGRATV